MPREEEVAALVPILEDPANADKTTEEIAVAIIAKLGQVDSYLAQRDRTARMRAKREATGIGIAVVAQYSLDCGQSWHHAVLGPFPTRTDAMPAGEGFAGRPTQPGQGRFMLVPAYPTTREAWAAIQPTRADLIELARIRRASGWNPWAPDGGACRCGVRRSDPRDDGRCPVHPERSLP